MDCIYEHSDEILVSGQLSLTVFNMIISGLIDREKFPSIKLHLIVLTYVVIITVMTLIMVLLFQYKKSKLIIQFFYIYFGMYVAGIIGLVTSLLLIVEESLVKPGLIGFSSVLTVFLIIYLILHLVKYWSFKKKQKTIRLNRLESLKTRIPDSPGFVAEMNSG